MSVSVFTPQTAQQVGLGSYRINNLYRDFELQYFTVPEKLKHRIKRGLYVPVFSANTYYNDKVAEAIACNVARKVYEVFGNTEQAAAMQKEIEAALQSMNV